jgi:crotonobetainyl-CoA:carnitine CoA-transferase CaiB-like acyl-CoA transferase
MSDQGRVATLRPLGGIRVLEVGQGSAAALAGMVLADYGAEVIKVVPPRGDLAAQYPGSIMWDRGKTALTVDFAVADGVDQVGDLLEGADVLMTALDPRSDAARVLAGLNQRARTDLIRADISRSGRYEIAGLAGGIAGYEHVVAAAVGRFQGLDRLSGAAHGVGEGRPVFSAAPVGTYGAAMLCVQGILGGLWRRARTGEGASVSTSILQGMTAAVMRFPFRRVLGSDQVEPRDHSASLTVKGIALCFLTVECSDGRFIQMCARQDHHFRNWLTVLGLSHLLADPRFADAPMGLRCEEDVDELENLLREKMRQRSQGEWMEVFIHDTDVGADPFLTGQEFLDHPQLAANDRLVALNHSHYGSLRQLGHIATIRGADLGVPVPLHGPVVGQVVWQERQTDPRTIPAARRETPRSTSRLPFEGVTVLELAYYLAAPLGATLLAELGARVVKVEPPQGDSYRRAGVEFIHMVHGKESIALDLGRDGARDVLYRLIARSDVLLTNFRPGVPDRLGFGFEEAIEINPQLVYLYAASYGSKGDQAHRPAFHSTPNALSGGGIRQAGQGNAPVDDSYPDPVSGLGVGTALALGLMTRDATGRGCYLETSMLVSTGYALSNELCSAATSPAPPVDSGQHGTGPLYRLYECASGWIFLGVRRESEWHSMRQALGHRLGLESPSWLAASSDRLVLEQALAVMFKRDTAAAWVEMLVGAGVPATRADGEGFEKVLHHVGFLSPAEHPSVGPYWRLAPRIELDGVAPDRRPATGVGEYTETILAELGYAPAEVQALIEQRVAAASLEGT